MIERDTTTSVAHPSPAGRDGDAPPPQGAPPGSVPSTGLARGVSPVAAGTFEDVPIGDYLRRQRVLRDVSIEELAAITRIPLRSLERLERGEFDGETDGFVRGFVRTVAEALGLDVEDTVARMLEEPAGARWERHAPGRRAKQLAVLATLLVLLGAVVLVARAGWRVIAGAADDDPARAPMVWRDPVHALAEATGAEVDPALEIDPAEGSRAVTEDLDGLLRRGYAPAVARSAIERSSSAAAAPATTASAAEGR